MLVSRPKVRQEFGERARKWVEGECGWACVAKLYTDFLQAVAEGRAPVQSIIAEPEKAAVAFAAAEEPPAAPADPEPEPEAAPEPASEQPAAETVVEPEYLFGWAESAPSHAYVNTHLTRLQKTLEITPSGGADQRILEMGAYLQITPALKEKLGYGEVRGCYYGPAGKVEHRVATASDGHRFECDIELFNAEKDRFPYDDEYFSTVLCCELIEHLIEDPMFMMGEINRILKPGGHLVLTTPNIGSLRAISAILQGYHPGFFPAYIRPAKEGEEAEARHTREYMPKEIYRLLLDSGFDVALLETGEFREQPRPELIWVSHLLEEYLLPTDLRGDGIYAVGRKAGPVRKRYPAWLYDGGE
jgi:SAM-dependent methyltransferase